MTRANRSLAALRGAAGHGWVMVALLSVALLTLAAGVVAVGLHSATMTSSDDLADVRKEAVTAGRAHAKVILSYDYRTLQRDFRRGQQATTGDFRTDYRKTTDKLVKKTAKKYHTVVTAKVVGASVVNAGEDKVRLLLYVDQNTVSDLKKNGRLDQNRVLMTLKDVNGKWLVSKLDSL
ncbi:MAG: hypothetical protein ACRDMV_06030 [Streptosporangiales bacterium]